jgi:serine/threonine protein kinase
MTSDELSRIQEIYEKALSKSNAIRNAFLAEECQGKPEIREEVERLLKARGSVPAWLEQPVAGLARAFVGAEPPKREGRRLSGYTLIREIGRGGMGSVYLAERSEGVFRRQVAVKLVLPSLNTAGVMLRFQQERAILASLDHPNMARLLDGGVTD